ncbi:MAG TPA: hypothetical protein OIM53_07120 [Sutterellaceae bacterium]|nr:hypothetical protein [Sutterellaceae bacterium]
MTVILLPVKPAFANRLLNGTKKYEYRKRMPKQCVQQILIYSTFPEMKVVGIAEVVDKLEATPTNLWKRTKQHAGISQEKYREYFKGCRLAYAFKIGNVWPLETALKLTDLDINFAPQSFIYLEKDNPKQFALVKQLIRSEKVY